MNYWLCGNATPWNFNNFFQMSFSSNMPFLPLCLYFLSVQLHLPGSPGRPAGLRSEAVLRGLLPESLLARTNFSSQSPQAITPHYSKGSLQMRILGNTWKSLGPPQTTNQNLHFIKISGSILYTLDFSSQSVIIWFSPLVSIYSNFQFRFPKKKIISYSCYPQYIRLWNIALYSLHSV